MKMKNIAAVMLAVASFAAPFASRAAANGDIYEILPVDENGAKTDAPTEPLDGGDVARFAVRLMKPTLVGNQFRLVHTGLNSEAVDWMANRPAIGIYVNGAFTLAYLEKVNARTDVFTDFVFSYTVKPGDFALPIRLAAADKSMVTDSLYEPTGAYYVNFLDTSLGAAAWKVDDSVEGGAAATRTANFFYGTMRYQASSPDYAERHTDYDLARCNFNLKTVDFDARDESAQYWRTVHQHATEAQPVSTTPSLVVSGLPTNSVTLYVWSENPGAVEVIAGRDVSRVLTCDVHVDATTTETRQVGEIKVVAGKQEYEFNLRGVAQGNDAEIVMSATPDFNYSSGSGARLADYVSRMVRCVEPQPASVSVKPGKSSVIASSDYLVYVTELAVSLSENPLDHDIEVEVVPGFNTACPNDWWDYVRFTSDPGTDPTLTPPTANPVLVFKAGETVPSFMDGVPLSDGKIYVFALRSDDYVRGTSKMTFKVTTTDTQALKPSSEGGIDGWNTLQSSLQIDAPGSQANPPETIRSIEGYEMPVEIGAQRGLSIVVADTYADMTCTDGGYQVWVARNIGTDPTFLQLPGLYRPGKGNVLYLTNSTDTLPTVSYAEPGTNSTLVYVISPVSGSQSANYPFKIEVVTPVGFDVVTTTGLYEFNEGDEVQVKISLDEGNVGGNYGKTIYAFIKGETDEATEVLNCTWKAVAGGKGRPLKVASGASISSGCKFVVRDGDGSTMGSTYSYDIVFLNQDSWTDDPAALVTAFQQNNSLVLTTHNVVPYVDTVTLGLYEVSENGGTVGGDNPAKLPLGIEQTLSVSVVEPGEIDKTSTVTPFQTRWIFKDEDGITYGPVEPASASATGIVEGDPDTIECKFDFPAEGRWTVTVDLKDKDMSKFGNGTLGGKFTFYVNVIDQPAITVRAESSYTEYECVDMGGEAEVTVALDLNNCNFDMWVNLVIEPNKAGGTGSFLLQESDGDVVRQPDGSYNVRFPRRATTRTILVQTMDGTTDTRTTGFRITPTMVEDNVHIVPNSGGKHPHEYYLGAVTTPVRVYNEAPLVDPDFDLSPPPETTNECSIGVVGTPITWSFTDVIGDFAGGITVEVSGGGRYTQVVTSPDDAAGSFSPVFDSPGVYTVVLKITDKDNGVVNFRWFYNVAYARPLHILAHGPSIGNGTANSKRYRTASGLGEGRVWANVAGYGSDDPYQILTFEKYYRFDKDQSNQKVYALGYKVGETDEAIDPAGNKATAAPYYEYGDARYDSFRYTWISLTRSSENSSLIDAIMGNATDPEYPGSPYSGTLAALVDPHTPTGANNDNASGYLIYDDTLLEAVFAKEYLPTDNCGDINADGIPDVCVDKFGFGVVDTSSGLLTGDDLQSLSHAERNNPDEDFLPAFDTSAFGSFIPGIASTWATVGAKFTSKLEIRGNGPSLNDALSNNAYTSIPGIKPDRVYTDPRTDPLSTLDGYDGEMPVEYLAWLEYAAANGLDPEDAANWTKWSPERPTDPTVEDTDGDGFTDGYEYFIWYRAHVGYNDNGVHRYMTGRKYDPRNPGEGRFLSSAEIKAAYDPVVPNETLSEDQDTDNDGLPDLIEFTIGTNPFDFDTDGDGLPDGFEIMLAGTDPLLSHTTIGICDAMRNYDGDAMAYTCPDFETKLLIPAAKHVKLLTSFALVEADGDTDGVQWYVMPTEEMPTNIAYADDGEGYIVRVGNVRYVTVNAPAFVTRGSVVRLAADLPPETTWQADTFTDPADGTDKLVRLMPTRLVAGTVLAGEPDVSATTPYGHVYFEAKVEDSMTAWPYGRKDVDTTTTGGNIANQGGFGFLAIGRYKNAPENVAIASLPDAERKEDKTIAYLHHMVFQEFGFDPRTAWNANSPLGTRWGKTIDGVDENGFTSSEAKLNNVNGEFPYVGLAARSRDYTLYDEFLVLSFFLNGLADGERMAVRPSKTNPWYKIWSRYTTNGRGPGEASLREDNENYRGRDVVEGSSEVNGADTDGDGVPDGWELYVMSGPKRYDQNKKKYYFRLPAPYDDGYLSAFGPFEPMAKNASYTDNSATSGYATAGGDADGLTEYQEFAGTDTTLYYADFSTTITRPEEHKNWLNKFFPTNPWNGDTDGDGVGDSGEKGAFAYGTPADNGALITIPGGGLNPLSVDTDFDGLPDGWELQFKGKKVYSGDKAVYAEGLDGAEKGNPLQGYVDGMDGTVPDAFTIVSGSISTSGEIQRHDLVRSDGSTEFGLVNRDYDRDGLENWQEYLVGTMRCWRYDDIFTPWDGIPDELYWDDDDNFLPLYGDFDAINAMFGDGTIDTSAPDGGMGEFWYRTLVDKTSPIYNPRILSDQTTGAQYFSHITNVWDLAYIDDAAGGAYYYFKDRIDDVSLEDLWAKPFMQESGKAGAFVTKPNKYISCSPLEADSDHDGMDDYYELFHGMNPLLGESGVSLDSEGPCDIVYDAWHAYGSDALFEAWNGSKDPKNPANQWAKFVMDGVCYKTGEPPRGTGYDFEYFPWLNGLATADPDGDDIRNQAEAIMPKLATSTWLHTDPTPLWMTDTTYDRSLTRLFFRMPGRDRWVITPGDYFEYNGVTYWFTDFGGWLPAALFIPPRFVECRQDLWWGLYGAGSPNWVASFEENEGYDTDHDAMSDLDEAKGELRAASDPQDANSPNRRQAMYFQGEAKPSALQTPLPVAEQYPVSQEGYPDEMTFFKFTVEAWVMAETLADATIVERAIWCDPAKAGDEELVRKNFQLGVKNGKWYAKYDSNGTLGNSAVEILSVADVEVGAWHHVAATFDGARFVLYVDGQSAAVPVETSLQPEYGSSAVVVRRNNSSDDNILGSHSVGDYWRDVDYAVKTFVVGASLKTQSEGGEQKAFDVYKAAGWRYYTRFFQGYIDEVRIWDGARTSADIAADVAAKVRYTRTQALENRSAFYDDWMRQGNRYKRDVNGNDIDQIPELICHFSFDSVPGGADEQAVAKVPNGFDCYQPAALGNTERGSAVLSRPLDWNVAWWSEILGAYGSVYSSDQWVQWVPNTVAHLPRFDGTTLDSFFWSDNTCGGTNGTYNFAMTAEPASRWVQMAYSDTRTSATYKAPGFRHHLVCELDGLVGASETTNASEAASAELFQKFRFTGRHALQDGTDMLPLGGAFAKACPTMWDGQGAATPWEVTSDDADGNGLPDIWEEYAVANYSPESEPLTWNTIVTWRSPDGAGELRITAGEAYRRDLANGRIVASNEDGDLEVTLREDLVQTADEDHGGIPDWWEELYGIFGKGALADSDNDGLSNYSEYFVSYKSGLGIMLNPKMPMSDSTTIDYFRKAGSLYLGEMFTDHDFMEDWLEDRFNLDRYVYDANLDNDGDGWGNWSEVRVGTRPDKSATLVLDDGTVNEYPTPAIRIRANYSGTVSGTNAQFVVKAYSGSGLGAADATWTVSANGEAAEKERLLGMNTGAELSIGLGPGKVIPGSVNVYFRDPGEVVYGADGSAVVMNPQDSQWRHGMSEKPIAGDSQHSLLAGVRYDRTIPLGGVDYENCVATIRLGDVPQYLYHFGNMWTYEEKEVNKDSEYVRVDTSQSYVKITWRSRFISDESGWDFVLSKADAGHVREGLNTFVAFCDVNGDGEYTADEPFGFVRDVNVGYDKVPEVCIELRDEPLAGARFHVEPQSNAVTRVRVVRTSINGVATAPRTVWAKTLDLREGRTFTEADLVRKGEWDFDGKWLVRDAARHLKVAGDDVVSAEYEVRVGEGETAVATFTRTWPREASAPVPTWACTNAGYIVSSVRPELAWSATAGCPSFVLQMAKDEDFADIVYTTTNLMPAAAVKGCVFRPEAYVGGELEDQTTYYWRVAPLNAKVTYDVWSETASFHTAVDSTNHDTGYGKLDVEVRYYGPAEATLDDVVVGVYEAADFATAPVARRRLGGVDSVSTLVHDTARPFAEVAANVSFDGIAPGQYYVMAFIDSNTNGVREAYESWGYVCKVGADAANKWTPVSLTVSSVNVDVPRAFLVMEDTDVNQNKTPDCLEDMTGWKSGVDISGDSDRDGLTGDEEDGEYGTDPYKWDTDGDGMPDGWEADFGGTDPLTPDADYAADRDVMAYAVTNMTVIAVWDGVDHASAVDKYVVLDVDADIRVGDDAAALAGVLAHAYDYAGKYGLGMAADAVELAGMRVYDIEEGAEVALVHAQVYDAFGFDPTTAIPPVLAQDGSNYVYGANTKPFTALDKYLVCRYLENVYGLADEVAMNTNRTWALYTLKPGDRDCDRDGVADGWELYVKYSPWNFDDRFDDDDGDGVALVREYDAREPFDPWNVYSVYDKLRANGWLLPGTSMFTDAEARRFRIGSEEMDEDDDNDLITNVEEIQAYYYDRAALADINPRKAWSDGATPDYFRAAGSTYLGLLFNGGEFIEPEWRDALALGDRSLAGTRNFRMSGWDAWSIARNSDASATTGVADSDLAFVLDYFDAVVPGECTAKTLPELREFVHEKWNGVKRDVRQGDYWDDDYSYSYAYDEATGTYSYSYGNDTENDDESVTWMTLQGDQLVTLDEMILFFGGREAMTKTIAKNKEAATEEDIVVPEPKVDLTLKYAGDVKSVVLVEAWQVNPSYPEYGEQRTAFWNVSGGFSAGIAKIQLATANSGALVQGPARFVAYIDVDGDGKLSAGDTAGSTTCEIGYLGCALTISMGEANPALPALSLSDGTNSVSTLALVRTAINGKPLYNGAKGVYIVQFPNNAAREALYPGEYDTGTYIGIDPTLASLDNVDEIESVTYEVLRLKADEVAGLSVTNLNNYMVVTATEVDGEETLVTNVVSQAVNEEVTIWYSLDRDVAQSIACAGSTADDFTFTFTVPTDTANTKFWLNVQTNGAAGATLLGGTKGFILNDIRNGVVVLDKAWFEANRVTIPTGLTKFGVVLGNDKFGRPSPANCAMAEVFINEGASFDGRLAVKVEHPTAALGAKIAVAAYESEDLANPVVVANGCAAGETVELTGLRPGASYYVAAWYVNDAGDGRGPAERRMPYDTWGYFCTLNVTNASQVAGSMAFDAVAVKAELAPSATNTVWLQDTDWNDNNVVDREEDFRAVNGDYQRSVDPVYGFEIAGVDNSDLFSDAMESDVFAYAEVPFYCVMAEVGGAETWFAVADLVAETVADKVTLGIPVGTPLSDLKTLKATYLYDFGKPNAKRLALGTNVVWTGSEKVIGVVDGKDLILVHSQVYDYFGFNPSTANGSLDKPEWVNTRAFTSADKTYVTNYLANVLGVADAWQYALPNDHVDADSVADGRGDGVPDGWELYVKHSPWEFADRDSDVDGDGATLLREYGYDLGTHRAYPTDPWDVDTDCDGVTDNFYHDYLLWNAGGDADGDGLANYAEYLASEVFHFAKLDPLNMKTDGGCVDYFRKVGDLYLGEILTDHDQVDDVWEGANASIANRYVYDPSRDDDDNGWSNYAESRAENDESTWIQVDVETNGVAATPVMAYSGHPLPKVELTVNYNGGLLQYGKKASLVVEAYSGDDMSVPDAVFVVSNAVGRGTSKLTLHVPARGALKEGANTFVAYMVVVDEDGGSGGKDGDLSSGGYAPGAPFGVARGVDVGWQGASCTVDLSETHAVSTRIALWDDAGDRDAYIDEPTYGMYDPRNQTIVPLDDLIKQPEDMGESVRIRVVRFAVDGFLGYSSGLTNRVVYDRIFTQSARPFLCEADFLGDGEFDIDWEHFAAESAHLPRYDYAVTNVSYLVVVGNGPVALLRSTDSNTVITALSTQITRRYDAKYAQPVAVGLADGSILRSARPTFVWSMPNESDYAKRFGSSYTAFRIVLQDGDTDEVIWMSDVTRAPAQDAQGRFSWTAPICVGDAIRGDDGVARVFKKSGNFKWYVAMYNAKFKPNADVAYDGWSDSASFSTSVDTQQTTDDGGYSAVDVAVRYAGPVAVLGGCEDVSAAAGTVRVQAFATADFSGEPLAQGFVADMASITNTLDVTANARLIGLPFGKFFVRAYIDSNGNFEKDAWESWGCAKEPVEVVAGRTAPVSGVWIEDADTDTDCLPDAWEYVKYGSLDSHGATVDSDGRIVLKKATYDNIVAGKANISKFLSGATLTLFENLEAATLLLGLGDTKTATVDAIRELVAKNIDPSTFKVSALVLDTEARKVRITVEADVTDSIAGKMLSPVYDLPAIGSVTLKVYRRNDLATAGWGEPIKTVTATYSPSMLETVIEVDLGNDIDFSSGFFKVEME